MHPFVVNSFMSFATCVYFHSCHHNHNIEHSITSLRFPHVYLQSVSVLTPPNQSSSQATTSLLSVNVAYFLPFPEFFYKRNSTVFNPLFLASIMQHSAVEYISSLFLLPHNTPIYGYTIIVSCIQL